LGKYCKLDINFEEIKQEYTRFKFAVHGNFQPQEGQKKRDIFDIWQELFQFYGEEYKETLHLAKFFLTIPMNTAECERGFSLKNRLKTKARNGLYTTTIDHLMRVGLTRDIDMYAVLQHFVHKKQGNLQIYQFN